MNHKKTKARNGRCLFILFGSLSTVVGDEKLTSREDQIGLLFFYV